ncbi:MAG TPA: hypothetical protein VJ302_33530 [Blastocatellia bacterium]|nr:hypothetical protein [Blastocatellia bacterium]
MLNRNLGWPGQMMLACGLTLVSLFSAANVLAADPPTVLTIGKSSYTVGEQPVLTVAGAAANKPIWWSSWIYNEQLGQFVSTGERGVYYGDVTDARGNFTTIVATCTKAHLGFWKRQVEIDGKISFVTYLVTPKIRLDKSIYAVGERPVITILGAPPNTKVLWSGWANGVLTGTTDADYGHLTDAEGNFTITAAALTRADLGLWKKQAKVGAYPTSVEYAVVP